MRSCLDVSRARADFDLADPIPLTAGLARTLDWVRTLT
jgi:UDP-glucose 4-epimerase